MDYTPTSARRVLFAFSITALVALTPVFVVFIQVAPIGAPGGYRGVMSDLIGVAFAVSLLALSFAAIVIGRRVVRRPSRA